MVLLDYLFVKPVEIVLEIFFSIFGRILDTNIDVILVCLFGSFLFFPVYVVTRKLNNILEIKEKSSKKTIIVCLLVIAKIIMILCIFYATLSFFSELGVLSGTTLLGIRDLSETDQLLSLFGIKINVLPVCFLVIRFFSIFIIKKSRLLQIVLIGETLLLFVLLYPTPSATVIFWVIYSMVSVCVKLLLNSKLLKQTVLEYHKSKKGNILLDGNPDYIVFFLEIIYIISLLGCYIPTNIIAVSPAEFVEVLNIKSPLGYVAYSTILAFGTFGIWGILLYICCEKQLKNCLEFGIFIIGASGFVNYIVAGSYLGEMSTTLFYFEFKDFDVVRIIIGYAIFLLLAVLAFILIRKAKSFLRVIIATQLVVLFIPIVCNVIKINKVYRSLDYLKEDYSVSDIIHLSKTGKNVLVIIEDRALGSEVPYIFNERPELVKQFDGFTIYSNTVSYGGFTNVAIPSVYGGYEYTPERMNKRDNEPVYEKHDEALKVMPVLFSENGYNVVVCDPVYAGNNWIPDVSIYNEYPSITAYNTKGKFSDPTLEDYVGEKDLLKRNLFLHSIMKTVPLNWQFLLYQEGQYCNPNFNYSKVSEDSLYKSSGYNSDFLDAYLVLKNLVNITTVDNGEENNMLLFYNSTPHMPCLLQEPDYTPQKNVDNTEYHLDDEKRYEINGVKLEMESSAQINHFDANMATYIQLGNWFDYLRENDCYDNTRIILVSDHGRDVHLLDDIDGQDVEVEFFMPILMVKDFNSKGLRTSEEFMTNADVVSLAAKDIIKDAKNPFSGNALDGHEKNEGEIKVLFSEKRNLDQNQGNRYEPGSWFSVHDNPYNLNNWKYIGFY